MNRSETLRALRQLGRAVQQIADAFIPPAQRQRVQIRRASHPCPLAINGHAYNRRRRTR